MYGKRFNLLLFTTLILLSVSILFAAPTGKVEGYVLDSQTGDALPGANVVIEGTGFGAATDMNGKFIIPQVPVGNYQLSVVYMGYEDKTVDIEINEDETATQVVNLDFKTIQGEVITVTAQAKGQLEAINRQRSSLQVTNVVAADRIQEVPDANAAESVGRLPGISLKRSSGEGNEVVVRGLQPRFNLITVNNIRMPSTNEYNTAVGLAGVSQYMLDGIEVRKSLTAQDDADVVGGIIDLKLATAPEGFHWNVILDGMYNGLTESYGSYRGSLQGSNRFFDGALGVIAQVNIEKADRTNNALSAGFNKDQSLTNNRGVFLTNGNFQMDDITRDRFGVNVLLDYKLPKGKIQLNSIYNKLDEDRWERDYQFNVAAGAIGVNKDMHSINEQNYSLVNGLSLESEIFGIAYFDMGAALTSGRRDGYNKSLSFWYDASVEEPINPVFTDNTFKKTAYDIIPFFQDSSSNYTISRLNRADPTFEENENTFQANLKIPFNLSNQISAYVKFGGKMRLKDRKYDYRYDGDLGGIYGGDVNINIEMIADNPEIDWPWTWANRPPDQTALPAYPLYSNKKYKVLEDRVILKEFAERHWVDQIVDRAKASNWANLTLWRTSASDLQNDYSGDEKLYAGYIMTEFNLGKSLLLNAGLRYESEETKYKGYGVWDIASAADILDTLDAVKRTNEFLLPSATFRYNYADWGDVRLAYSQSLARPEYYAFVPHYYADLRRTFSGSAGNTHLKPAVSSNFDLILSFYNSYIGLFTVGGFYKEIEDFFYQANFEVIDPVEDNKMHDYDFVVPKGQYINVWLNLENTSYVRGVEFDLQTRFWYLPSPLNGLVMGVNYTKISSQAYYYQADNLQEYIDPTQPWLGIIETRVDSFQTRRLIDQPDNIFNMSMGYDYKGFSMRLAYYFQGRTLSWKSNDNETDGFAHNYSRLDLSVRQKLPIKGLSLQFLLSNLTEEAEKSYTYKTKYNNGEQYYGMTGSLGLRYEF